MGMAIKNNMSAVRILNVMERNSNALAKNLQRVSSGLRINSAADDPSGYAIGQRMEMQIRSLNAATENAQKSLSLLRTAEGAVQSTIDILTTMKERALHAASDTCSNADRKIIQKELDQLIDQINDNANVTFNDKVLLNGSLSKATEETANVFTNELLSVDTTGTSTLVSLRDENGKLLDIKDSDMIKVSFVKNGQTYTTSFSAKHATLEDIFKNANAVSGNTFGNVTAGSLIGKDENGINLYNPDGSPVISVAAGKPGTKDAISGISICVIGSDGNVKKNINEKLDAFNEQIRAYDKMGNNSMSSQIGTKPNQTINTNFSDMRAPALGLQGEDSVTGTVKNIDVTTRDKANAAVKVIDTALERALDQQTSIGAQAQRLEYTIENLTLASENLTAALSTIRDANMAKEITEFTKNNILMQASQAMLAQANQSAMGILNLLK